MKKEDKMTLKKIRENANLTQEEVSKLTGLSLRFISMIETGKRKPSDNSRFKLAKAYKVPVEDIFLASYSTKCSIKDQK